ncbi:MAG: hypothetical protein HW416_3647, partial [Chloroflexi bacterium]|nr:hypothetical protein [Chloroflexota bacterium]
TRPNAIAQIALQLWQARTPGKEPYADVRVTLPNLEGAGAPLVFGFEGPEVVLAVSRGELDLGTLNPSAFLTMAYRGTGPFPQPLPVRAIAVMPSFDLMGFALAGRTGLTSLAQVREQHFPLRVSVRDDASHSPLFAVEEVLGAEGITLADIEAWGGSIQRLEQPPGHPERTDAMRSGKVDAVFDEAINAWGPVALEAGFRFAHLQDSTLAHMQQIGWLVHPLSMRFPALKEDVLTIDFSGWPLYTRADLPDETAYRITDALFRARETIQWDLDRPVELTDLRGGSQACPIGVPLHPGAERFYREHGAIK